MKRLMISGLSLALLVGTVMLPGISSAQSDYDLNTGCGLGNQLFREIGQNSLLFQVLAVTTNGILGNQTFGISSGTLGCKRVSKVVQNEKMEKFVSENMDSLAQDIAAGQGESLTTLAELMNIPAEKRGEFFTAMQVNFTKIYSSDKVQSADVIENIAAIN